MCQQLSIMGSAQKLLGNNLQHRPCPQVRKSHWQQTIIPGDDSVSQKSTLTPSHGKMLFWFTCSQYVDESASGLERKPLRELPLRETVSHTFFLSKTKRHNTRHALRGDPGQWSLQCKGNGKGDEGGERKENSICDFREKGILGPTLQVRNK